MPRRKKRLRPARFYFEALEGRVLLANYTVNSTDPGLGGPNVNTLTEAIGLANADTTDSSPFVINFDIPTSDSGYNSTTGVWTIALIGSGLPVITHPVVIDATTQPGYKGQPLIELDGTKAIVGFVQGLEFHVGGNTVKGLDIANSENFGIVLDGTNDPNHNTGPGLNNIIQACYIGTDPTGEGAEPNFAGGIDVVNSSYNLIGGLNLASPGGSIPGQLVQGNLISGNGVTGIFLSDQGDTHNYIEGDYIGTDASGMKALDATNLPAPIKVGDGIFLGPALGHSSDGFASNNIIGDFDPNKMQFDANGRNIIAGQRNGVYILGCTGNQVVGNYIGVGADGATPIPNFEDGVRLEDASSNTIGAAGDGNVISANLHNGVEIVADGASEDGTAVPFPLQISENNLVQANYIGTNEAGTAAVPNGGPTGSGTQGFGDGVLLDSAGSALVASNTIGGNAITTTGNLISGNAGSGVALLGAAIQTNLVQGNYIGIDATGEKPLGNQQGGVYVTGIVGQSGGPTGNIIGSALTGGLGGNVISANIGDGVRIVNGCSATHVNGNLIGVDALGAQTDPDGQPNSGDELGNHGNGVRIEQAAGNFVGDALAGGNTIGGNFQSGVLIAGADAQNNVLVRNLIGVGLSNSVYTKLPNGQGGVRITGALGDGAPSLNTMGGANPGASYLGNIISGNHLDGVEIDGGATLTKILGNFIGTDPTSLTSLGNDGNGINIVGSSLNTVGGTSVATRNIIVNNAASGVVIQGAAAKGNIVSGDYVGVAADGVTAAGNGTEGVLLQNGTTSNFIGSTAQFGDNVISGNLGAGVLLASAGAGNTIQNNFIGINAAGTGVLAKSDQGTGIVVDNTAGTVIGATSFSLGGNVISGGQFNGIFVGGTGSVGTQIEGNYIGTDLNAATPVPNVAAGISLGATSEVPAAIGPSSKTTITANTIGGNQQGGIALASGTNGNTIISNFIGTNAQGAKLGNTGYGIKIDGSPNNVIGISTPNASFGNTIANTINVISASVRIGGTKAGDGIDVIESASHNMIGGVNNADANSIHDNADAGVHVQAGSNGIAIMHNALFNNGGLGILLDPAAGGNQGGNNSLPPPTLRLATTGASHRLAGWLSGAPNAVYSVEFFTGQYAQFTNGNEDDDAERLLVLPLQQSTSVFTNSNGSLMTTSSSGVAIFDLLLPQNIAEGTVIRATATDASGNTSQLSNPAVVASTDSDGDGEPDAIEANGPNGVSKGPGVVTFQDAVNPNSYITLEAPPGVTFQNAWSVPMPAPPDQNGPPANTQFPLGFASFTMANIPVSTAGQPPASVLVTMILPPTATAPTSYWRYGKTPDKPTDHWYNWMYPQPDGLGDGLLTGAQFLGNKILLHFVNGGTGDDDLDPNNTTIIDAGGPGFPDPYTVTNTADSGTGSLRQAILNANADTVPHVITFDIPGAGPFSIQPVSALPALTNQVTIDGTSQPGYAGAPLVEIDGSQAGTGVNGLVLNVQNSTVQGLAINRFSGDGLLLNSDGSYNTVDIHGNYIGTDVTGTKALGNGGFGIEVNDVTDVLIGDSSNNGRNVISANAGGGIFFHGSNASSNGVENDLIGTQADGVSPLGNGGPGILFDADADYNAIGPYNSSSKDEGNIIAFNAGPGVQVAQAVGNHIRANSILSNGAGGIDLTGVASNNVQSSPVLTSAASQVGATHVTGTFAGTPNDRLTLDFYASATRDRSGVVEGQTFLGSKDMFTDSSGNAAFDVTLPASATPGSYVTATATDSAKGTSSFSAALQIPVPPPPTPRVFTVNTTDDVNDAVPDPAHFSLREAILAANSNPGLDTIDFDLPKGKYVIRPTSALPDITDPVIIDGTSQPGFRGLPLVELDGSQAGQNADGLRITGGGSIVRGLIVHSFQQAGIELAGGGGSTIEGNFLGTDATGTSAMPDPFSDVYVNGSNDNLIGGTTAAARNVVTFVHVTGYNQNTGVVDPNAGGNRIEGNYIGTDLTGTALSSGAAARGVTVDTSHGNTVGGTEVGAGNLIAGGVNIFDGNSNVVQGNLIGTNDKGTIALAGGAGVDIDGEAFSTAHNQIGGTTPAARNIIAGTVHISGRLGLFNEVEGNYIGTDITGTVALGPGIGVEIEGADNTIGGAGPGEGNLISGNPGGGVKLLGSNNVVAGNRIGTDASGTKPLGNGNYGILSDGSNNTIGGTAPGAGNVISGNLAYDNSAGIELAGVGGDQVEGNYIGTASTGTVALGNGYGDGIDVEENYAIVGGFQPGAGNVISGNYGNGITVVDGSFPSGVVIEGNKIGTDVTGTSALGNGGDGIGISGSPHDVIGGASAEAGNLISANGGDGIRIADQNDVDLGHVSIGTLIEGNTIGADVTGTRPMGNACDGISIVTSNYFASDETIGGIDPGAGNLVAFNGGRGVSVSFGNGNTVRGNDIFANGGLGLITDINGTLSTYAEARGLALPHAAPVLTSAVFNPQGTVVSGTFSGMPLTTYDIDLFSNEAVNPSGFGDGQTYLESISVLTDQNGSGEFQIPLDAAVPVGKWITATATPEQTPPAPPSGPVPIPYPNTSGFSQPVAVVTAVDASDVQFTAPTYVATENGGAAVVTVTRTGSAAGTATVDYATSDGSAMAGADYTTTSGTLVFNDGDTSKTITVPVQDDGVADPNKTFQINLSNASGASLGSVSQAAVTIADDSQAGQIAFASPTFAADFSLANPLLTLTRTGGNHGRVTVDFRVTGGTAVPFVMQPGSGNQDYEDNFGTVTFDDGQTTATISFLYVDDLVNGLLTHVYDGPLTIEVTLGNPTGGATLGAINTSVLTLDDEEFLHGAFGISSLSDTKVPENAGSAQIDVFRVGQLSTTESVNYSTMGGSAQAGTNYIAKSGSLIFQPGQNEAFVNIPLIPDRVVGPPGDFQVVLSNPSGGAFIFPGYSSVDVTILDSDVPTPGRFVVESQSFSEDSNVAQVTVERFSGTSGTAQVNYATGDGTATAGLDYQAESGTLTFNPGQTSQTFSVPILRHNFVGQEKFYVTLSNPTGGATLDPNNPATETLFGTPGQVQIASASYPVAENNDELTVTIPFDVNFFAIPGLPAGNFGGYSGF